MHTWYLSCSDNLKKVMKFKWLVIILLDSHKQTFAIVIVTPQTDMR